MSDSTSVLMMGLALGTGPIGLGVAQGVNAQEGASAGNQALDLKAKQNDVFFEQKKVAEYQKLNANLDRQAAISSASGTSARSPSLAAITLGTTRKGAQAQKNIEIESEIARANIAAERANISNKLKGDLFGIAGTTMSQVAQIGSMVPV